MVWKRKEVSYSPLGLGGGAALCLRPAGTPAALGVFSVVRVAGRPAHDVSLKCATIGGGSCASAVEGKMPLPSKVVPDYRNIGSRRSLFERAEGQ